MRTRLMMIPVKSPNCVGEAFSAALTRSSKWLFSLRRLGMQSVGDLETEVLGR